MIRILIWLLAPQLTVELPCDFFAGALDEPQK
jgi:hypothetical protein